eukprot:2010280-Amphidinium_carterae.1
MIIRKYVEMVEPRSILPSSSVESVDLIVNVIGEWFVVLVQVVESAAPGLITACPGGSVVEAVDGRLLLPNPDHVLPV